MYVACLHAPASVLARDPGEESSEEEHPAAHKPKTSADAVTEFPLLLLPPPLLSWPPSPGIVPGGAFFFVLHDELDQGALVRVVDVVACAVRPASQRVFK